MDTPMPAVSEAQLAVIQQKLALDAKRRNGINWFYWIAALSIINTVIYLAGGTISFIFGLGLTQVIDGFAFVMVEDLGSAYNALRYVAVALDLFIAGIFVLFGFLGNKNIRWMIIVGMLVYAADAVLCFLFEDYLSALFHLWALFGIFSGLGALNQLRKLEQLGGVEAIESLRQRMPVVKPEVSPANRTLRYVTVGICVVVILVFFGYILITAIW